MSVANEIERLQQAKADLKTAIEAKGVTVPTSAKLDDYPDLVAEIEQGSTGNWILEAKGGTVVITPEQMADLIANPYCTGLFEYNSFGVNSLTFTGLTSLSKNRQFVRFLYYTTASGPGLSSGCVDVSFPDLTSVEKSYASFSEFARSSKAIKSFAAPSLLSINNNDCFGNAFYGSSVETLNFHSVQSVTAVTACQRLAISASSLTSVDFSSLETISGSNVFQDAFTGCTKLTDYFIHPQALSYSGATLNPLASATAVRNLTITATATDNVYLSKNNNLTSASILEVLNHLSTSATGKTCAFANLTVASSDENYSAISAKVAALTNWTITGLTL